MNSCRRLHNTKTTSRIVARLVARALSLVAMALVLCACPLVRDPAELIEGVNAEVHLAGGQPGDVVALEIDDVTQAVTLRDDGAPVVFRLALAEGAHPANLVLQRADLAIGCASFALLIEGDDGRDSAAFDLDTLGACDTGEGEGDEGEGDGDEGEGEGEGEGEEGEGEGEGEGDGEEGEGEGEPCIVGDPCDDGVECTHDDRCLQPGVCVGQVAAADVEDCQCASSCNAATACCLVENDCSDPRNVCITECLRGPCDCNGGACTANLNGDDATCVDAACRFAVTGSASTSIHCDDAATCDIELANVGLGDVECTGSRCVVDAVGGEFAAVECTNTDACFVTTGATEDTSLTCEDASCALDCTSEVGGTCALSCEDGGDCLLSCAGAGTCDLTCAPTATRCELACADEVVSCIGGDTCSCP